MVVVGGCSDWSRLKIVASGLSSPSPSLGIAAGGTVFEGAGLGEVLHLITCGYFGFFLFATYVQGQSVREEAWARFSYCGGLLWSSLVWYFLATVHVDMIN